MPSTYPLLRRAAVLRVAWACLLIAAPDRLIALVGGRPATPPAVLTARILGVRHTAQAVVTLIAPPRAAAPGAAADLLHAATAVALAAASARWRGTAIADALVAAVFAGAGLGPIVSVKHRKER
ncbi:hypothetical protein [Dactylosporangium aurantiacum]|nr:hypothetical protein [Dactylosporangium aurantiacum]